MFIDSFKTSILRKEKFVDGAVMNQEVPEIQTPTPSLKKTEAALRGFTCARFGQEFGGIRSNGIRALFALNQMKNLVFLQSGTL
jgi:hypothetical protein